MTGYEEIPLLEDIGESGEPPAERLSGARALRGIYQQMHEDDLVSAANRAEHQDLLDNAPPYVDAELNEANMQHATNLNWGGAEQQLERAMAPYYRLVQSPENLLALKTLHGEEDARPDWNDILSEEVSRMIRKADFYSFQTLLFIQESVKEGLGIGYYPDAIDWRWRGAGLDKFLFDRQRVAAESEQEIVCCREEYTIPRLWKQVSNLADGGAPLKGWNKRAVRAAINQSKEGTADFDDWERFQDEIRNNDLFVSQIIPPVTVVHGWIQEFDGTWSHYIIPEEDTGVDEFLYKSRRRYNSLSEMLVLFPYGLGTNYKIHGLRGLIFKIYPHEQQRNRSLCRLLDQGLLASSLILQAQDESALNSIGLQYLGNTAVLGPEWKAAAVTMPDLQRSVMPSIEIMERLRNDRVAGYSSENVFDGDQRKTKFEVSAHLEQSAALSDSALDFFYLPLERMLCQSVRRMIRRTYSPQEPGGREIAALKIRLLKRGVPLEAFYRIDWEATEVVRAIGAGSSAAKTLSLARLGELRPRMDDVGQSRLDRAIAVDSVGSANADQFFPRDGKERTTVQNNVAILESRDLLRGEDTPVLPSDRHLVHAREHTRILTEEMQGADMIEDSETLAQLALRVQLLWVHGATHVDQIEGDPAVEAEAAALRQLYQQLGEMINNGLKAAKKMAEEGGGEQQEGQPDPEMIKEMERHRQKLDNAQQEFEQKMANLAKETEMKIAVEDVKAAAQIARNRQIDRSKPAKSTKASK